MLSNKSEGRRQSRLQQKRLTKGPVDFLVADNQPGQTEPLVVVPSTTSSFSTIVSTVYINYKAI